MTTKPNKFVLLFLLKYDLEGEVIGGGVMASLESSETQPYLKGSLEGIREFMSGSGWELIPHPEDGVMGHVGFKRHDIEYTLKEIHHEYLNEDVLPKLGKWYYPDEEDTSILELHEPVIIVPIIAVLKVIPLGPVYGTEPISVWEDWREKLMSQFPDYKHVT